MVKLNGEAVPVDSLSEQDRNRMLELMEEHYENTSPDSFIRDLNEKQWAVVLKDPKSTIQGFTTLMTISMDCENKKVLGIFSGDTIIARDFWGSMELHKVWGRFVFQIASYYKNTPAYWFLISKGYKTYRFLPTYFKEFYPRYDCPTPEFEKKLMDRFGFCKYPESYCSDKGLVIFDVPKDYLKSGVADISERRLKDPHIAFFTRKNPGYIKGDELVCIAPLTKTNLNPYAIKHFLEGSYDE